MSFTVAVYHNDRHCRTCRTTIPESMWVLYWFHFRKDFLAKSYRPCLYLSRVYYITILTLGKVISSMFMPICSILYFHTYSQRSQTFRRPYCPMIICRLLIVLDAAFGRVTHPKFWSSDLSSTLNSILTNIKISFIFQCI